MRFVGFLISVLLLGACRPSVRPSKDASHPPSGSAFAEGEATYSKAVLGVCQASQKNLLSQCGGSATKMNDGHVQRTTLQYRDSSGSNYAQASCNFFFGTQDATCLNDRIDIIYEYGQADGPALDLSSS